ncbi:MAG: putative phage abortive infection protein, partial [Cyanobacteria bacterium J06649_11]
KFLLWLGIILFCFGLVLFAWQDKLFLWSSGINSEKVGHLGDFVGGVIGAFWSLAGVILFYVALREQRVDIKINQEALENQIKALNQQIREFELQRQELSDTKKIFEEQSKTQKLVRFENTFFQLLNVHSQIVDGIDLRKKEAPTSVIATGRDCFGTFSRRLNQKIIDVRVEAERKGDEIGSLKKAYMDFFEPEDADLGHYFRHLYHILKFVDQAEIEEDQKKRYTNFVRAQLSSHELILLYYNCLVGYGVDKFKKFVEKYALLKQLRKDLIDHGLRVEVQYEERAFS